MATQNNTEIVTLEKKAAQYSSAITEWITADMSNPAKGLKVPEGYDYQNEIASAMLYIAQNVQSKDKRPALEVCTQDSVMSAIRDMAIQGLSITRHHAYPIVYGNQLKMMESYFGKQYALKNLNPDLEIGANVLYQGDAYDYCTDEIGSYNYITNVRSSLDNRDKPIIGAYGSIYEKSTGKRLYGCVMTMKEIQTAWSHGQTDRVQKEFPQEMAKRTLINRLIKLYLNTTPNLNAEFVAAFNRTTENEFDNDNDLQNVTPPESEIEKQKMLHSKSKGAVGLKAILEADKKAPQNASIEQEHEITPSEPENASERQQGANETKPAMNNNGSIPESDENSPEVFTDENGEVSFIPF